MILGSVPYSFFLLGSVHSFCSFVLGSVPSFSCVEDLYLHLIIFDFLPNQHWLRARRSRTFSSKNNSKHGKHCFVNVFYQVSRWPQAGKSQAISFKNSQLIVLLSLFDQDYDGFAGITCYVLKWKWLDLDT